MPPLQTQPKVNEQLRVVQRLGAGEVTRMLSTWRVRHVAALVLEVGPEPQPQPPNRVGVTAPLLE